MSRSSEDGFSPWQNPTSRRQHRRWGVDVSTYVEVDGTTYYCLLSDISPSGARLRVVDGDVPEPGVRVSLDLEGFGPIPAEVRHASSSGVGVMFLHGTAGEVRLARWLIEAKPSRRQSRHACRIEAVLRRQGSEHDCVVVNISRSGAALVLEKIESLEISTEVELLLPGYKAMAASVRHVEGRQVGLMLIDGFEGELPLSRSYLVARPAKHLACR